jgi:hypothetical protein
MVIHFELHSSWTQSLLFGDALKAGVSLGKDNHWHYNGITGKGLFRDDLRDSAFWQGADRFVIRSDSNDCYMTSLPPL